MSDPKVPQPPDPSLALKQETEEKNTSLNVPQGGGPKPSDKSGYAAKVSLNLEELEKAAAADPPSARNHLA